MSLIRAARRRSARSKRKGNKSGVRRFFKRPLTEQLEQRQLLSADGLAAIADVAFDTAPTDGMVETGLWRDGDTLTREPVALNNEAEGEDPDIQVIKTVEDTPDGETLVLDQPMTVTYYYEVTNIGDTFLSNIQVIDDQGTPDYPDDDIFLDVPPGTLEGGESITLSAEIYVYEDRVNTATATGLPTDQFGFPVGLGPVMNTDDASVVINQPEVEIVKTAGDAEDGDTLSIDDPQLVDFTYEVTNTGETYLSGIEVMDDNGTPYDSSDDFLVGMISGPLATGNMATFTASLFVSADYTNTATVTAKATDSSGSHLLGFGPVTALDDAVVELVEPLVPDMEIVKTAGNAADGDSLLISSPQLVDFKYEVTNTGETHLSDIKVIDDNGTPDDASDDFTAGAISGPLAPGSTATFFAKVTVSSDLTNLATVTATPTDGNGEDLPDMGDMSTTDDAVVEFVDDPAVQIVETVEDILDGETLELDQPLTVTYYYEVTNVGDTFLSNIEVIDDQGTPDFSADDTFVGVIPGTLGPDESMTLSADMFVFEDRVNTATATGTPTDQHGYPLSDLDAVMATDDASVVINLPDDPAIQIIKTVEDVPDGETLVLDQPLTVTYFYEVINVGDTHLSNIEVIDDQGTPDFPDDDIFVGVIPGTLGPDESMTLSADIFVFEDRVNTATATGTPTDQYGYPLADLDSVMATDDASVVIDLPDDPGIQVIKTVEDIPDGGTLVLDQPLTVTYFYEVINVGDTHLTNIEVIDDQGTPDFPDDDIYVGVIPGTMEPGESMTLSADIFVFEDRVNIATATGTPTDEYGNWIAGFDPVTGTDDAEVIIEYKPASISGKVFVDLNGNGYFDSDHYLEEIELPGVEIILTRLDQQQPDQVAFTDEWGDWGFYDLDPGVYKVTQIQPPGYADGPNLQGVPGLGGVVEYEPGIVDDMFTEIALQPGVDAFGYDFTERLFSKRDFLARGSYCQHHYHDHYDY